MSYLDGRDDGVSVQMYRGRAVGMSFPMDGNKHNDSWTVRTYPVTVAGKETEVSIKTYEDGSLIAVEVGLPDTVTRLSTNAS